jgi:hypothetical protein
LISFLNQGFENRFKPYVSILELSEFDDSKKMIFILRVRVGGLETLLLPVLVVEFSQYVYLDTLVFDAGSKKIPKLQYVSLRIEFKDVILE